MSNPNPLTDLPSYLITRIAHRYNQTVHSELKALGLTTTATRVLASLAVFEELTINALCVHALAEQPTMSRALDRMEEDGLIARKINHEDNRVRVIRLTPEGAQQAARIWPAMQSANDALLDGISETDKEITLRTLRKVLETIRVHPI